jgi:hypothetical protein
MPDQEHFPSDRDLSRPTSRFCAESILAGLLMIATVALYLW